MRLVKLELAKLNKSKLSPSRKVKPFVKSSAR